MSVQLSSYIALGIALFAHICAAQTTVTVAAAADLTDLEQPLASAFAEADPGNRVRFVTGSSGVLAQQIENGAPYDVFLSANAQYVDRLSSASKILPGSVHIYAVGRIALLWREGKRHQLSDLAQNWVRFVAIPNPQLAPYGVAAEQSIRHAGIWELVRPKIVFGENVRQTLQLFDSGNADAVLTSDSLVRTRNAEVIPDDWHAPIEQKCGIVAGSAHKELSRRFVAFLLGPKSQAIFAEYGFSPPTP
jgi:molybdate transport system substrate-binding protein